MIDPDLTRAIGDVVGLSTAIGVWFYIRRLERRWGCQNDWEFMALVYKKVKSRLVGDKSSKN